MANIIFTKSYLLCGLKELHYLHKLGDSFVYSRKYFKINAST